MPTRRNVIGDAERRAVQQLDQTINDLRAARLAAGLSQGRVAQALGCSRPWVTQLERRDVEPGVVFLSRWGALVGLDVPIRTFPAGPPLRDAGQLRLLRRFREAVGSEWSWQTEAPVSHDPRDRRAIDAVLSRDGYRVGAEAIVRLTDAQSQTRGIILKQEVSGVDRMVLVLADTRNNRAVLPDAAPTLAPAFPLGSREVLRALRSGTLPEANGVVCI